MKKFLIQNKEVFVVSYMIAAKSEEDAANRWLDDAEEIDTTYVCDLSEYTNYSAPYIREIKEENELDVD